jgi:hypothetical protein
MDVEIYRSKSRLDAVFGQATTVGGLGGDPELQAHFARYLCVLVSGFLEISIRRILAEYSRTHSDPNVAKYVSARLENFRNPKSENIYQLTGGFSTSWEAALRTATLGELKDAVDSIVANRHRIAHGESVGLSMVVLKDYYRRVVKFVEVFESHCQ